jgi:hypothetical protein
LNEHFIITSKASGFLTKCSFYPKGDKAEDNKKNPSNMISGWLFKILFQGTNYKKNLLHVEVLWLILSFLAYLKSKKFEMKPKRNIIKSELEFSRLNVVKV